MKCSVIISCGKNKVKTENAVPLYALYTGHQTKLKIELARKIAERIDDIYVVSGGLGVVPIHYYRRPYDSNNNLPDKSLVKKQILSYRLMNCLIYIGQRKYFIFLQKFVPNLINLFHCRNSQDFCLQIQDFIANIQKVEVRINESKIENF